MHSYTLVSAFFSFFLICENFEGMQGSGRFPYKSRNRGGWKIPHAKLRRLINKKVSSFSKQFQFPFQSLDDIFKALIILNKRPNISKTIDGEVCKLRNSYEVHLLATCLKEELAKIPCLTGNNKETAVSRKRRSLVSGERKINVLRQMGVSLDLMDAADVSQVSIIEQGAVEDGTKNMCKETKFSITLPRNYYPRNHVHIVCGPSERNGCLSRNGACRRVEKFQSIVKRDSDNTILRETILKITTGCQCEVNASSDLADLVDP